MTSWYELPERLKKKLDYDLVACLEYNPQEEPMTVDNIDNVLAVYEGTKDEEDWRWVLEMITGEFILLRGGCDYTGWDCQSWAEWVVGVSAEDACLREICIKIQLVLAEQVALGKKQVWREEKDLEFNILNYDLWDEAK